MNWGYRIFVSFVLFVGLIVTLVTISMRQDINLVAEDYYEQEIEYQDQIDRLKRTSELKVQPEIRLVKPENLVVIAMNQEKVEKGEALFFRPSDSTMDKLVTITNNASREISVAGWEPGLWKVKLSWQADGKEFYTEKTIFL